MTTESSTPAPAEEADATEADNAADTAEVTEPEDATEEAEDPGKEAAKYRRRLREAEAARDDLAVKVEALQRQHVAQLLEGHGVKPEALFATVELSDVLATDGTVDSGKVAKAVASARERFGISPPPKGNLVKGVGNQPSGAPRVDAWKQAFTPSRKR